MNLLVQRALDDACHDVSVLVGRALDDSWHEGYDAAMMAIEGAAALDEEAILRVLAMWRLGLPKEGES